MSDLPDINTSNVGFLAFWNALDDGQVSDIDPDEVTNSGRVSNAVFYDNGLTFDYQIPLQNQDRTVSGRCKEDGWLVIYMDRTLEIDRNVNYTNTLPQGPYDLMDNWQQVDTRDNQDEPNSSVITNNLARGINHLQGQFSNSANISFNYSDVGLYNYNHTGATTTTCFSVATWGGTGGTFEFSYTASTDLYEVLATGACTSDDNLDQQTVSFEGTQLAQVASDPYDAEFGVVDAIAGGLVPNAGTAYGHDISSQGYDTRGDVLTVWG